jgi:hypothetical protein
MRPTRGIVILSEGAHSTIVSPAVEGPAFHFPILRNISPKGGSRTNPRHHAVTHHHVSLPIPGLDNPAPSLTTHNYQLTTAASGIYIIYLSTLDFTCLSRYIKQVARLPSG